MIGAMGVAICVAVRVSIVGISIVGVVRIVGMVGMAVVVTIGTVMVLMMVLMRMTFLIHGVHILFTGFTFRFVRQWNGHGRSGSLHKTCAEGGRRTNVQETARYTVYANEGSGYAPPMEKTSLQELKNAGGIVTLDVSSGYTCA